MIVTRHMSLREALGGDAEFTYNLRNNDPRHLLEPIQGTVANQRDYIIRSRANPDETMWIVSHNSAPVGMVRWTELNNPERFGWESLLISPKAPPSVGIDVIVTSLSYAFRCAQRPVLGPWRVPHWNVQMQRIHERMGFAKVVDSDKEHLWYAVTREWFDDAFDKWHARGFGHLI